MTNRGKTFKYGNNVDTDVIIPARYLNTSEPNELAMHCMEDIDKNFARNVRAGDIIVAEDNFGCGSSREHAPIAIKAAGVYCVIANTFARIFYRNSFNIGLPILECPEAVEGTSMGDVLEVDLGLGTINNVTTGKSYRAEPLPEFMQNIIKANGLINYISKKSNKAEGEDKDEI
jgi:3-isopropylmalate dehydratase small subunit